MDFESKEDQTAPVSELDIEKAIKFDQIDKKEHLVECILASLNEKRDAYNGIVSSIIYIIDSKDDLLNTSLRNGLVQALTCRPMRYAGKILISKALTRLTSERPLFVLDLFEQIIETAQVWSSNFKDEHDDNRVLQLQIISIKAIRQAESSKGSRPTQLDQAMIDQLCIESIYKCDDSTKIDTLSLILESRSTTKPLDDKELQLFRVLFQDALSLQEPSLRQMFIAQTNKLIKRIKDSYRVVLRDSKSYSEDQKQAIGSRYMQFLTWMIEFCFDSIYCNAYFGSFILTISTLKLTIQHVTFTDNHLPIEPLFNQRRCYDSVLSCLNDSFEENKILAFELLLSLPHNDKFLNESNLAHFEKLAYELVGSANPAHSLTCQYVFKLVVGLRHKQSNSKVSKNQLLYQHLSNLLNIVEDGIRATQEDFVMALKHKSIYPKLSCIRALLNDVDINDLEIDRLKWSHLAKRIVLSSIEACKSVSNIVCNLNPETIGHLPMDLKPVDVDTLSKTLKVSLKISDSSRNMITSQMLLICGWKTIKECSLSLGTMCTRFWWPKERIRMRKEKFPGFKAEPILESNDIIEIINFFEHYLRNLRHRGAFEQAYNGFIMVTRRIWHDEHFRTLLIDMLHQIMDDFRNDTLDDKKVECLKAYVTRRSAGLPFIVQAILNSEHKHDSKTLRWVMDSLFEVLHSEESKQYQRIHCLNILRALIKEHFLGEKVLPYVGKTFSITMDCFRSDSFPIRNCANMLLKAIVDRTFGVNRLRDDIHRRNQLSFEKFFTECPGLHKEMLKHLKDGLEDRSCLAAVHSVFIVLFRLRPSLNPSREFSTETVIKPFLEPILNLTYQCPDYKLRELAAKLVVRLDRFCSPTDRREAENEFYLNGVRDIIFNGRKEVTQNELHGALLLTKNLVEIQTKEYAEKASRLDQDERILCFAHQVVSKMCSLGWSTLSSSIIVVVFDLAECCCLARPHNNNEWIRDLKSLVDHESLMDTSRYSCLPHFETSIFRYITVSLMGILSRAPANLWDTELDVDEILDLMIRIITNEPNKVLSVNIQASFLRILRQLLTTSTDDFLDKLLDKLDLDSTATHMTPFDKLNTKTENDLDRDIWLRYCEQTHLRGYLTRRSSLTRLTKIAKLESYREFQPMFKSIVHKQDSIFKSKFSNTPRSIELMTFIYKNWELLDLKNLYERGDDTINGRLKFLTQFLTNLPDCDVKCMALLCAAKLLIDEISQLANMKDNESEHLTGRFRVVQDFTGLLDNLVDGDHELTIRQTCAEVLRLNLKAAIKHKSKHSQGCLMNLFSALIKLSQDEEYDLRLSSQMIMADLNVSESINGKQLGNLLTIGSRLDRLILLIATELFDPNKDDETNSCFELLTRIIFNHSKNYSNDVNEERERLFDKTKLNTFADHVATVSSSLNGLRVFFQARREGKFDLNSLRLPNDILAELRVIDSQSSNETGDYSWRLEKVMANQRTCNEPFDGNNQRIDNNRVMDDFLSNVFDSLSYFEGGYSSMLTDTEYTYHELSLYKRVTFIKFVLDCTQHRLQNGHLILKIRDRLQTIVDEISSTTLLYKCLKLMN